MRFLSFSSGVRHKGNVVDEIRFDSGDEGGWHQYCFFKDDMSSNDVEGYWEMLHGKEKA